MTHQINTQERFLLEWLGRGDGQYGECHGAALEGLVAKGFAIVGVAGEGVDSMYLGVSITDAGCAALQSQGASHGD